MQLSYGDLLKLVALLCGIGAALQQQRDMLRRLTQLEKTVERLIWHIRGNNQ